MTAPDLSTETLRRLLDEATPGPWQALSEDLGAEWGMNWSITRKINVTDDVAEWVGSGGNAALIALSPTLAHEVLRLREAQVWQPIETAPKDGEEVLVFFGVVAMEVASIKDGEWIVACEARPCFAKPTHWMPLPAPPPEGDT